MQDFDFTQMIDPSEVMCGAQLELQEAKQYLFASFDTHLMLMARFVMQISINGTDLPTLEKGLSRWWVEKDAAQIAHSIIERLRRVQSDDHVPISSTDPNFIPKMIAEGEQRVIDLV